MDKAKSFLLGLDLKTLTIIGLVIILLLTRVCSSGEQTNLPKVKVDGKTYELVKHTVDTVTIVKNKVEYRPGKVIYKDTPIYLEHPSNIDTSAVIKEYYSKVVYKDTLKLDQEEGIITVTDTISQNKIIGRLWKASIKHKTIHDVTIVKELPKTQVYIGGVAGFNRVDLINFVGPSVLLKTKQDHIYSLGVGYSNAKALTIQGGIYWKIRLGSK